MHFLKEGQKIQAGVDPPTPHSGNAQKKMFFFSIEAFPNINIIMRSFLLGVVEYVKYQIINFGHI